MKMIPFATIVEFGGRCKSDLKFRRVLVRAETASVTKPITEVSNKKGKEKLG